MVNVPFRSGRRAYIIILGVCNSLERVIMHVTYMLHFTTEIHIRGRCHKNQTSVKCHRLFVKCLSQSRRLHCFETAEMPRQRPHQPRRHHHALKDTINTTVFPNKKLGESSTVYVCVSEEVSEKNRLLIDIYVLTSTPDIGQSCGALQRLKTPSHQIAGHVQALKNMQIQINAQPTTGSSIGTS